MRLTLLASTLGMIALCAQEPIFRSDVRLVEVYATVLDNKGRFVDDIPRQDFHIFENGQRQELVAFEPQGGGMSCVLLIDTTGSMLKALPAVKNSALHFIDQLRAEDSIAIYSFTTSLQLLLSFTSDHDAAKRSVLRMRAGGGTALFDAIAQVSHEISGRSGKKAVIVLTDGEDNASALRAPAAIARAKKTGVPIYTIAEGEALREAHLLEALQDLSVGTGGKSFRAKHSTDVKSTFQEILNDYEHTYMLTYSPPHGDRITWRKILVEIADKPGYRVRAKNGYFPE